MANAKSQDALIQEFGYFMTIDDVAKAMKVNRRKVDALIRRGQLPGSKAVGNFRIKTTDLIDWWERRVEAEQKQIFRGGPA